MVRVVEFALLLVVFLFAGAFLRFRLFRMLRLMLRCVVRLPLVGRILRRLAVKVRMCLNKSCTQRQDPIIYPVLSLAQQRDLADAIRITFVGDLILLRDGVERGWQREKGTYDFTDVFSRVRRYWKDADLVVGCFEGPLAGADVGWSTSDYYDASYVPLRLNFPDAFASAVKEAGVGLVTTANNHCLDCGEDGALRTLDVLDQIGLDHTGTYRNQQEKNRVKVVTVKGRRIAFLTYTYGSNYYPEDYFFDTKTSFITRPLVSVSSKRLKENVEMVRADFAQVKKENPDLIVVLPHMGEQFLHAPDKTQRFWCDVFVENGADVVVTVHAHAVQPVEWRRRNDRNVLIVHCLGNFVNTYAPHDGDASMMVEACFSPGEMQPFAAAVVPLCSYGKPHGNYIAFPTYDAIVDRDAYSEMGGGDQRRVSEVNELVTQIACGARIPLVNAQDRYYVFACNGYVRNPVPRLAEAELNGDGPLLDLIRDASTICFVGDSVTEGTLNGGIGWYEPLMACFPEKKTVCFAKGSTASGYFLENSKTIAAIEADAFVCAFGCNDIRYRDSTVCAMTATDYVKNIDAVACEILKGNAKARICFVAPWMSLNCDRNWKGSIKEKENLYRDYTDALRRYCEGKGFAFVDPNPVLEPLIKNDLHRREYMIDYIHPGANGTRLYSKACIQ